LIRFVADKNNNNIDQKLVDKFNMFIDLHQLQEIRRSGSKYTWTNKQSNHVMGNLDGILVSTDWEAKFPKCFVWSKTRVGSNHWPVVLDTGEKTSCKQKFFYFEKQWMLGDDFIDKFGSNWKMVRDRFADQR
jgi:hypothetical protein